MIFLVKINALIEKIANNLVLSTVVFPTVILIFFLSYQIYIKNIKQSRHFFLILIATAFLESFFFFSGLTTFFIPDLLLLTLIALGVIRLKKEISLKILFVSLIIVGYVFFSPQHLNLEFDNNYLVPLKPFFYLGLIYLVNESRFSFNLRPLVYGVIIAYPLLLILNIFLYFARDNYFITRPNFLFENNFEVPFYITCFAISAFIYKNKDFRIYLLTALAVLLTGSRSGLICFLAISIIYSFTLSRYKVLLALLPIATVLAYVLFIRGIPTFSISSIDRLQTFNALLALYDYNLTNIFNTPFGYGIYQKLPPFVCMSIENYAEWSTGNPSNCDPIMLQSFFTRGLFQYGIYMLALIPVAFYLELKAMMGLYLGSIFILPLIIASLSVGGFSNGLAISGLLLAILAFNQEKTFQNAINNNY